MNKSEVTSARVASEAGIVMTHADPMIARLTKSKIAMDALVDGPSTLSDDLAGCIVLLGSCKIVAASALTQAADKVGFAPPDDTLTEAQKRERNS